MKTNCIPFSTRVLIFNILQKMEIEKMTYKQIAQAVKRQHNVSLSDAQLRRLVSDTGRKPKRLRNRNPAGTNGQSTTCKINALTARIEALEVVVQSQGNRIQELEGEGRR